MNLQNKRMNAQLANQSEAIPPMSFPRALLFFGLPLLLMTAIFRGLIPLMDLMGVRMFNTWMVAVSVPMLILLLLSIRFYRKEGYSWNRNQFSRRFRLIRMSGTDWLWTVVLSAFLLVTHQVLSFTATWISRFVPVPKFLIRMLEDDPYYFMELPMAGNWILLGATLLMILLVVCGQEFWLRGYILPRQELVHGKWTWIVHGLLWTAWYLFLPWYSVRYLPGALAIAYVAQRRRNTWPGLVAHFAMYLPILGKIFSRVVDN